MQISIRLATSAEAPRVHAIMQRAYAEYQGHLKPPSGAHAESVDDVLAAMARGGAVLACIGEQAVGSARFELAPDYLYFGRLAVLPEARRHGVGRAIVGWLEQYARDRGLPRVRLGVRLALPRNWRWYRDMGYRIDSLQPRAGGEEVTASMVKDLQPPSPEAAAAPLRRLLAGLVADLRAAEPGARGILLFGSLARGDAGPFSDVDVRVITAGEPRRHDRTRFAPRPDGGLWHLSIGSRAEAAIIAQAQDPAQWGWVQAKYNSARLLWEEPGTLARLQAAIAACRPARVTPAAGAAHHLENLLEFLAKVKNAAATGDHDRACWFAGRLATGTLALLRQHQDALALPDDLGAALADGTLERYARQEQGWPCTAL